MSRRLTQEDFINRSKLSQSVEYDYSLAQYDGRVKSVEIICTKHGINFWQPAGLHMAGQTSCHGCVVEKKMASRAENRSKLVPAGYKICKTCEQIKSFSHFVVNNYGADGLYSVCKECSAEKGKAFRQIPENAEKIKRWNQQYTRDNRDKANAKTAARRAARLRATPSWAKDELEVLVMQEAYALAQQRKLMTGIDWHVDHIVPLKSDLVCGLHCAANLEVIPAVENLKKHNRHWPDMWL